MKVLFIGGTGTISSACVALAVTRDIELTLLNRGGSSRPVPVPDGVKRLQGNIRDKEAISRLIADLSFDVVVDFVAFTTEHIETDLELFRGRTKQFIFISSASAYQTPPLNLFTTESTPLRNPYWQYSRQKIECEDRLIRAYREEGFPITIVRPSHTYDPYSFPLQGDHTALRRLKAGKQIIVHGDGTSLWTLTHHRDFAKGFVGLLGNPHTIGEAIHITSDEALSWNQIVEIIASAAGVQANIVHLPSEFIAHFDKDWGDSLLGDKAHSMIFDNSKIKQLVPDFMATIPFRQGAAEIVNWYDNNPTAHRIDEKHDQLIDRLIGVYYASLK